MLTLVNTFGFSILFPILPYVLEDHGVGSFYYGLLLSVYSIFQFFACPFFGRISDQIGRKKILLLTQWWTFLSWIIFSIALLVPPDYAIYGYSEALLLMLLARIFDGITWGNQVVANAYVADVTEPEERRSQYATIGVLIGIGIIIWPVIGWFASLGPYGYLGTSLFAALISLVTLFFLWRWLKETIEPKANFRFSFVKAWREFDLFWWIEDFVGDRYLMHLFLVLIFFGFVFSGFSTVFLWYAKDVLWAGLYWSSLLWAAVGVMFAVNQILVVKKLWSFDDNRLVFMGFLFLVVWFWLFLKTPQMFWFLALSYLITLWISLCMPTFKAMLTKHVGEGSQWWALWIEESLYAFNRIIAPLFAWFVWWIAWSGLFGMFSLLCLVPLLLSYGMMMLKEK